MKLFFTTLLFIFAALQPTMQAQQCAPAHHVNPPFLVVPDTVRDWHAIETAPCFGNTLCSDFTNPFNEIVNFDISPALVGHFAIISTGHPTSHQAALTVMGRDCDSVLAQHCLAWPIDTLQFRNTTSKFSLWFQSASDTTVVTYTGWAPTGSQILNGQPSPCDLTTSIVHAPQIPTVKTYRSLDMIRAQLGDPSTTQPQGLSLRSDGVKVLRQGVPDGLALIFVVTIAVCIMHKTLRRMFGIASKHPDDDGPD